MEIIASFAALEHEGALTTFTGGDALEQAVEAAEDGDVITLSAGAFSWQNDVNLTINKSITLRGAGIDVNDGKNYTTIVKGNRNLVFDYANNPDMTITLEGIDVQYGIETNLSYDTENIGNGQLNINKCIIFSCFALVKNVMINSSKIYHLSVNQVSEVRCYNSVMFESRGTPYGTTYTNCVAVDSGEVSCLSAVASAQRRYLYWYDGNTEAAIGGQATSGQVHIDADVKGLPYGFHTLNYALLSCDDGSVTDMRFASFVKTAALAVDNLRLVYSFDESESCLSESSQAGENLYAFSIDVKSLSEGEHTINYMLTDGKYTYATGQATFTKTLVSGIGIVTFGKAADSPFYDLNGVKVEQPGKGLYIRDGKKVIVK